MDVIDEITEAVDAYTLEYLTICMAEEAAREFIKIARKFAEESGFTMEEAIWALQKAMGYKKDIRRKFPSHRTAWDRKEDREKRRAVERATAARFRQRKSRENVWSTKKRTGQRRREWRGPWKES